MIASVERYALVTGASSGIGRATALAFAKAGIHLALVGRSEAKLNIVAELVQALGVRVKVYPIDLTVLEQVRSRIEAIAVDWGQIDILVNNAGMAYTGELRDMPLADWQQVIDLNLTSVFQCVQAILPTMRRQKQGTIVNVASIAAHQAFPNWGAYCVSKFGLLALSKTLAAEERSQGIRVVTVSPGSVNTSLWDTETVRESFDRTLMLTPEVVADSILQAVLMPPGAVVEELILMPNAGAF